MLIADNQQHTASRQLNVKRIKLYVKQLQE
jgi:hypothetical protein